ncbi:hypothetical protein ACRYCC_21795 [Actinomadura scrupuli]|uniref:hypothetical protein n=1 Tax=Actinomadura scrupuli TaxID=559629 RepID=UPI003D9939EF
MADHGAFCYPWDVVGDPAAAGRMAGLGVGTITLAAAYHSVRAITPYHPAHRVVQAHHAAAYFPVRAHAWRDRRLRPTAPSWGVADPDPFGTAAAALRAAGLAVEAWIVLTHNTRLGLAHPDLSVRNTFGDRYPYALCPAHAEVREYLRTLVAEVTELYDLSGLVLEACGWLGVEHGAHHDKTQGLTPGQRELLSVCVCETCARALGTADAAALLRPDRRPLLRAHRAAVIGELLRDIRSVAGGLPITLMATDGLDHTGPDVGVDLAATGPLVEAYLLKCWGTEDEAAAGLAAARTRTDVRVLANVNVLEPGGDDPGGLAGRFRRLRRAGADGLRHYHAGLAAPSRLDALREALR